MAITANIAQNINTTQTGNFYFTVVFVTEGIIDTDGFTLDNIEISGSTDVSISDLTLLYVEDAFAVIAVDLPKQVSGSFQIGLTGTVSIDGTAESIDYQSKTINYYTIGIVDSTTYDTTPPPSGPTEVEITLSAAHIENSGIVIAQFDFDYSVPYFASSHVTVSAGATKSEVEVIDDEFRRWIMLIIVPESGEGMVEITVDEDAIGFTHEAVRGEVQHQQTIPLQIWEFGTTKPTIIPPVGNPGDANYMPEMGRHGTLNAAPMMGEIFEYAISVAGNNVNQVDIQALLQPFYHHWDATLGKLYIRSVGEVEEEYDDFTFTVSARDDNNQEPLSALGTFNEPIPMPPAIVIPDDPLEFSFGELNEHSIEINGNVTKVEVEGTWLGLKYKRSENGVDISGTIPEYGSAAGQAIPGINSGDFIVRAYNGLIQADPPSKIPWQLAISPQFVEGSFTGDYMINESFDDTIEIIALPAATLIVETGALPTGLTLETSHAGNKTTVSFSGSPTSVGTFTFTLKATNSRGAVISSVYSIQIISGLSAPSIKMMMPSQDWFQQPADFPLNVSSYFNLGSPVGTFSISGTNILHYQITSSGVITRITARRVGQTSITVTVTNSQGSISQVAGLYLVNA